MRVPTSRLTSASLSEGGLISYTSPMPRDATSWVISGAGINGQLRYMKIKQQHRITLNSPIEAKNDKNYDLAKQSFETAQTIRKLLKSDC